MKHLLWAAALLCATAACTTGSADNGSSALEKAEQAYAHGRYARSQELSDSLVTGAQFRNLDVDELCRLSMLLMRLGEKNDDEGATTAMATRCLSAAFGRDSDSTVAIIRDMPSEDRGRALMLAALNESAIPASSDSLVIPPDSIPDNEL